MYLGAERVRFLENAQPVLVAAVEMPAGANWAARDDRFPAASCERCGRIRPFHCVEPKLDEIGVGFGRFARAHHCLDRAARHRHAKLRVGHRGIRQGYLVPGFSSSRGSGSQVLGSGSRVLVPLFRVSQKKPPQPLD